MSFKNYLSILAISAIGGGTTKFFTYLLSIDVKETFN
jgi:hypothetical protein